MFEFLKSLSRTIRVFSALMGVITLLEPLRVWAAMLDGFDAMLAAVNLQISYSNFMAASVGLYRDFADAFFFWLPEPWRSGALLALILFGASAVSLLVALPPAMLAVTRRRVYKDQMLELTEAAGLDELGNEVKVDYSEKYGAMTRGDVEKYLMKRLRALGFADLHELRRSLADIRAELDKVRSSDDIFRRNFVGFSLSGYLLAIGLMMIVFALNYILYQQYVLESVVWVYIYAAPVALYFVYQMVFRDQISHGFPLDFCRWSVVVLIINLLLWPFVGGSWVGWGLLTTGGFLMGFSFVRISLH